MANILQAHMHCRHTFSIPIFFFMGKIFWMILRTFSNYFLCCIGLQKRETLDGFDGQIVHVEVKRVQFKTRNLGLIGWSLLLKFVQKLASFKVDISPSDWALNIEGWDVRT